MTSWTGGTGTTYYIIDIPIMWLTLVIVRYFLATSSILKVWPKGACWQAWGAGGRHWHRVLIYQTASGHFCRNFNCDIAIYVWCQLFKHSQPGCNESRKPTQAWLTLKTILVTDGQPHHSYYYWQWPATLAPSVRLCVSCTSCQVVPCLWRSINNIYLAAIVGSVNATVGYKSWHRWWVFIILLLLISWAFLARLAKWFHACNCQ